MKKKLLYGGFLLLCLALCLSLSLGFLLRGPSRAGGNEARTGKPALHTASGAWNWHVLADAADYFESRFYLRQELISCRNGLTAALLDTSPDDAVILGEAGWLYYSDTLEDYTGEGGMSDRALWAAAHNLALMQEHCTARGAAFLFTAAPNKNALYGDHMPDYAKLRAAQAAGGTRNVERLYGLLEEQGVRYLDLHRLLGSAEETLYFRHDSHWTTQGAALAADGINGMLGRESQYYQDPFTEQTPHSGDLYEMLYPAFSDRECDRVYGKLLTYGYEGPSKVDSITLKTHGPGQGRLLCYRDSFGNSLHPFLADSFGEAEFSRATAYDLCGVSDGDCVVIELVERNLHYLVENVPVMPAPLRSLSVDRKADTTVMLTAEQAAALAGFVRWSGCLPTSPDLRSGVYILSGDAAYECFLRTDGRFAAAVPEGVRPEAVAAMVDGCLTAFPIQ